MEIPHVSRPIMPGYGIAGPAEGSGLLHWSWAVERLTAARNYWVASVWPDGRPHIMAVWGMWDDGTLWFTSSAGSRKVRNLTADPRGCPRARRSGSRRARGGGRDRSVPARRGADRPAELAGARGRPDRHRPHAAAGQELRHLDVRFR